jgi:uncharacterized membrane protein
MFALSLLRFLHIGSAILLIGGIIARQLVRSIAKRSEDPRILAAMFQAADPIERVMVIPGSIATILFGVLLALVTRAPILGFLQGASRNWLLLSNVLILLTIPLVPLVFIPRGKVFGSRLEHALEEGRITPELRSSLADPVVGFFHGFEILVLLFVVFLMVFKPL